MKGIAVILGVGSRLAIKAEQVDSIWETSFAFFQKSLSNKKIQKFGPPLYTCL